MCGRLRVSKSFLEANRNFPLAHFWLAAVQVTNPVCPACSRPMSILRIESGEPDHQIRTYKCLDCRIVEVKMVKRR